MSLKNMTTKTTLVWIHKFYGKNLIYKSYESNQKSVCIAAYPYASLWRMRPVHIHTMDSGDFVMDEKDMDLSYY